MFDDEAAVLLFDKQASVLHPVGIYGSKLPFDHEILICDLNLNPTNFFLSRNLNQSCFLYRSIDRRNRSFRFFFNIAFFRCFVENYQSVNVVNFSPLFPPPNLVREKRALGLFINVFAPFGLFGAWDQLLGQLHISMFLSVVVTTALVFKITLNLKYKT